MQDPGPSTSSSSPSTSTSASTSGGGNNPLSQINFPIFLAQSEIATFLKTNCPTLIFRDNEDKRNRAEITREGQLNVSFQGKSIQGNMVVEGWAKKKKIAWSPPVRFKAKINFTLIWGINNDCTITVDLSTSLNWIKKPTIDLKIFEITLPEFIQNKAVEKLNSLSAGLKNKIAEKIQIKPKVLKLWNKISEPREISDNVYLQLNPQQLQLSPLTAVGDKLVTHVGLTSQPLLVASSQPPAQSAAVQQLPALTTNPTSLAADQFDITITSKIDFTSMQAELNKHLANKDYPVSTGGSGLFNFKATFHVDSFEVKKQDNTGNIEVIVNVSGDYKGKFTLKGKPVYDAENNVIKFNNFDYVADNFKFLSKINFIDLGFHKMIAKKMCKKLTFELDKPLNKLQDRGNLKLNKLCFGDHLQLNINLDQLRPVSIAIVNNSVVAEISLKGTSQAEVNLQKQSAKGPSR